MKKQTPRRNQTLVSLSRKRHSMALIKVVGIGGGGNKAVSRMMESSRIKGVEFIAINTDAQDLDYCSAHRKIYIGKAITRGLGAGMNPEIGKQAAEENRSEIGEALEGADIVFVTAGLGGGTGTPGSAVVAEIAREKGILTVAVVTKPFSFEGAQRQNIAVEGLARLKDKVDALVVIPNDRIFTLINKDTPLTRAFGYIDDVLKNAVQVIADLINSPGLINVDFADIKTTLKDAGTTLIGIGMASGPDRSVKAVNAAINSPLVEVSMEGAKGVLFSVAGGRDLKMSEVHEIAKAISTNLDANARVIFGAYHDRNLKDKNIKVTLIATGFNGVYNKTLSGTPSLFMNGDRRTPATAAEADETKIQLTAETEKPKKNAEEKSDSWEIPTFLRKRKR
jgi:cell division protein FtsZ